MELEKSKGYHVGCTRKPSFTSHLWPYITCPMYRGLSRIACAVVRESTHKAANISCGQDGKSLPNYHNFYGGDHEKTGNRFP